jgi:hypothetical protein
MSVPASRVLLGRLSMVALFAAAIFAGVHSAAAARDGQDPGSVRITADGCAHCPKDRPSPER